MDQPAAKEALVAAFRDAGFAGVVDKVAVLPAPELASQPMGIVTVSVAVMKTKPSHASELANQLLAGMVVKLLKKEGGWYYVQSLDDRYLGWMESDHLALVTGEQADAFARSPRVVVTSLFALVREQPSADAPAVADLVVGDVLEATGQAGAWTPVRTGRRAQGIRQPRGRRPTTGPGRRRAPSRPRTSSRRRAASWACPTCGAAPPPGGSTAPASSRPCSG